MSNLPERLLSGKSVESTAPDHDLALDCKILLVEDDPDNQRLISFILRRAGAEVSLADNGRIAIAKALAAARGQQPYDVILMDLEMPVMDGCTATRALRQAHYSGCIVALTARCSPQDEEAARQAGVDEFATKPVNRARLLAIIAHCLGQSHPTTA